MLHLRCGSDILDRLTTAGLPGQAAEWSDPLCDGPLEPWPDEPARRETRAPWIASRYGRDLAEVRSGLEAADGWLSCAPDEDEVVLWFEHDLFDQSILAYLLTRLESQAPERTSLICLGSHPEVPHFQGLGQLSAEQLAALFPTRQRVTAARFATARRGWAALAGADPRNIQVLVTEGTPELPSLAMALQRHLAEFPCVRNGLGLTEQLALQGVLAGADRPRDIFEVVQRFEDAPWLGDTMLFAKLRLLTQGPAPLLEPCGEAVPAVSDPGFLATRFELTLEGHLVMGEKADWYQLCSPAQWHGGVLLEGPEPAWRWDDRANLLVGGGARRVS